MKAKIEDPNYFIDYDDKDKFIIKIHDLYLASHSFSQGWNICKNCWHLIWADPNNKKPGKDWQHCIPICRAEICFNGTCTCGRPMPMVIL